MKSIAILGSTGSIGTQALDVIQKSNGKLKAVLLTANSNYKLLIEQANLYKPRYVGYNGANKDILLANLPSDCTLIDGDDYLLKCVNSTQYDRLLVSVVGESGLLPTIEAVKQGKSIALANKETMVIAGKYVMTLAKQYNAEILPVDSEHSAIWQCIGNKRQYLDKVYLTASGGAFREFSMEQLKNASFKQAMAHPIWNMGERVTVDSATMVNKGLEVIEAMHLFELNAQQIEVLIHRESIVHSMVGFIDGGIIAQLSVPDMRLPIQIALHYPNKAEAVVNRVDFAKLGKLTFSQPDLERFCGLKLGLQAAQLGGNYPAIFNSADQCAVKLFKEQRLTYFGIFDIIERCFEKFGDSNCCSIEQLININDRVKEYILNND